MWKNRKGSKYLQIYQCVFNLCLRTLRKFIGQTLNVKIKITDT